MTRLTKKFLALPGTNQSYKKQCQTRHNVMWFANIAEGFRKYPQDFPAKLPTYRENPKGFSEKS